MQSGIIFLPDGRAEARNDIPNDVAMTQWKDWSEAQRESVATLLNSWPVVSSDPDIQVSYLRMRVEGESHNMAEMLATRSFPGVKTDSIFNEGKFSGAAGRIDAEEVWLRKQAESAGVSTAGKWYCRGLASFPGDPTAWVGDRGDVLRIAQEKNLTVHGYVEHKGHEVDPGGDLAIDPEIVDSEVADILDSNPGARAEDVREHVYALRTGAIDPNPLRVGDYDESVFDENA